MLSDAQFQGWPSVHSRSSSSALPNRGFSVLLSKILSRMIESLPIDLLVINRWLREKSMDPSSSPLDTPSKKISSLNPISGIFCPLFIFRGGKPEWSVLNAAHSICPKKRRWMISGSWLSWNNTHILETQFFQVILCFLLLLHLFRNIV